MRIHPLTGVDGLNYESAHFLRPPDSPDSSPKCANRARSALFAHFADESGPSGGLKSRKSVCLHNSGHPPQLADGCTSQPQGKLEEPKGKQLKREPDQHEPTRSTHVSKLREGRPRLHSSRKPVSVSPSPARGASSSSRPSKIPRGSIADDIASANPRSRFLTETCKVPKQEVLEIMA